MLDLKIEAIEAADQFKRRRGATAHNANGSVKFPAAGGFLEGIKHANPDRGAAASNGYALAGHQAKNAFRIDVPAGENQARAEHGAGIMQPPGVAVAPVTGVQN